MTDKTENLAWIVLLLPLVSAVLITLFTKRHRHLSAQISIGAVALSFVVSLGLFFGLHDAKSVDSTAFNWLALGSSGADSLKIDLGLRVDSLSLLMLLVVT
ncbi:MAG TPA: NADH-quinone oxidoreductase subunit L, partial [Verrucomicrobiae bacterium]